MNAELAFLDVYKKIIIFWHKTCIINSTINQLPTKANTIQPIVMNKALFIIASLALIASLILMLEPATAFEFSAQPQIEQVVSQIDASQIKAALPSVLRP